jgi:hypothetical protein
VLIDVDDIDQLVQARTTDPDIITLAVEAVGLRTILDHVIDRTHHIDRLATAAGVDEDHTNLTNAVTEAVRSLIEDDVTRLTEIITAVQRAHA